MASTGHRLPLEVWLNIFYYISKTQDLGNYRLICKSLDPLAEKAMFRRVRLTPKNGRQLIAIITKRARVRQHVHCVELDFCGPNLLLYKQILKMLLLLPNLKILGGFISEEKYLKTLLTFVQKPEANSLKLERLPSAYNNNCEQYLQLLRHFNDTLQHTMAFEVYGRGYDDLTPTTSKYLPQLKGVVELYIDSYCGERSPIQAYDNLLRYFHHLKILNMYIKNSIRENHSPSTHLEQWITNEVNQVQSLDTLRIEFAHARFDPQILHYLARKYPKLKNLVIEGQLVKGQQLDPVFEKVEAFHIKECIILSFEEIADFVNTWKRQSNSFRLEYSKHRVGCKGVLNIKKEKQLDHAQYTIKDAYYRTRPLSSFVQFMSHLGSSKVNKIDIDLNTFENGARYEDAFPSDFLKVAPLVERLKLRASWIHLTQRMDLSQLHTVELINMDILTENMTNLGLSSPSLKHLTLTSCCLSSKVHSYWMQPRQVIDFSSNQLITLTLDGDIPSFYERKMGVKEKNEDTLIQLSIGQSEHHFFVKRSSSPSFKSSQQNAVLYSKPSAVITIKCKSLQKFKADLNGVKINVEFDSNGNINNR